jgi:hypothetical protein
LACRAVQNDRTLRASRNTQTPRVYWQYRFASTVWGDHTPTLTRATAASDEQTSRICRSFGKGTQPPSMAYVAYRKGGNTKFSRRVDPCVSGRVHRNNANPASPINVHSCTGARGHVRNHIGNKIAASEFIRILKGAHNAMRFYIA